MEWSSRWTRSWEVAAGSPRPLRSGRRPGTLKGYLPSDQRLRNPLPALRGCFLLYQRGRGTDAFRRAVSGLPITGESRVAPTQSSLLRSIERFGGGAAGQSVLPHPGENPLPLVAGVFAERTENRASDGRAAGPPANRCFRTRVKTPLPLVAGVFAGRTRNRGESSWGVRIRFAATVERPWSR